MRRFVIFFLFSALEAFSLKVDDGVVGHCRKEQVGTKIYQIPRDTIFYKYLDTSVVFLLGTSSAGKSSVVRDVVSKSLRKFDVFVSGNDDCEFKFWKSLIENNLPHIFLENLKKEISFETMVSYLKSEIYPWQYNLVRYKIEHQLSSHMKELLCSPQWKSMQKHLLAIRKNRSEYEFLRMDFLSRYFLDFLFSKKSVLVDAVSIDDFMKIMGLNFIRCNVSVVVMYTSPRQVLEHIISRNNGMYIDEIRLFFPYNQYLDIYSPVRVVGEAMKTNSVIKVRKSEFDFNFKDVILGSFKNISGDLEKENLILDLDDYNQWQAPSKTKILNYFLHYDCVYLEPSVKHSRLVNTEDVSICEVSKLIQLILNSK